MTPRSREYAPIDTSAGAPLRGGAAAFGGCTATDTLRLVQNGLLVAFVATAIVTDWKWRRIPNVLTYPTMLLGLGLSLGQGLGAIGAGGLIDHAAGLILAFAFTYPFYAGGGMKAGDVKFLMAVGAVRGLPFLLPAAIYGALIGGLVAIATVVAHLSTRPPVGEAPRTLKSAMRVWMPYGVSLGVGVLVALAVEVART